MTERKQIQQPLCPECKDCIPEGTKLEDHLAKCCKKSEEDRTCELCHQVFLKIPYLKKHMKNQHLKKESEVTGPSTDRNNEQRKSKKEKESSYYNDILKLSYESDIELDYEDEEEYDEPETLESIKPESISYKNEQKESIVVKEGQKESIREKLSKQLVSGRMYSKPTAPFLPGNTCNKNLNTDDKKDKSRESQERKIGGISETERKVQKRKREVTVIFSHQIVNGKKRQRFLIQEEEETSYDSTEVVPALKRLTRKSLELSDFIGDGEIRPSNFSITADDDGELIIKMKVENQ